jgi:hypothetical protein
MILRAWATGISGSPECEVGRQDLQSHLRFTRNIAWAQLFHSIKAARKEDLDALLDTAAEHSSASRVNFDEGDLIGVA